MVRQAAVDGAAVIAVARRGRPGRCRVAVIRAGLVTVTGVVAISRTA